MSQRSGEACDVSDDASADDQQGLVAAHRVLLHGHQDALHVLDALVHLIAAEHQLRELDVVGREVVVDLSAIVLVDLVVHDSDASPQGLVHVKEKVVGGVQNLTAGKCKMTAKLLHVAVQGSTDHWLAF